MCFTPFVMPLMAQWRWEYVHTLNTVKAFRIRKMAHVMGEKWGA